MWNCFSLKRGVKCLFVSSKKTKKHHRISIQYLAKWCKMHWKQSGISQRIFPSLRIPRISDHLELPKLVAYHSTHWTLRRAIEILPNHTCWLVTKRPACHVPYVIIHTVKDHFCNKFQLSFGDKEQQAVSNYPIACCCFGVITYGTMIYIYIYLYCQLGAASMNVHQHQALSILYWSVSSPQTKQVTPSHFTHSKCRPYKYPDPGDPGSFNFLGWTPRIQGFSTVKVRKLTAGSQQK